jgi:hypothetical protein
VRIVWIAALAAAFVVAAPASASMLPPPQLQTVHVLKVDGMRTPARSHSCMAQQARLKIARWLLPVACEQPPRSQLLLVAPLFGGA